MAGKNDPEVAAEPVAATPVEAPAAEPAPEAPPAPASEALEALPAPEAPTMAPEDAEATATLLRFRKRHPDTPQPEVIAQFEHPNA